LEACREIGAPTLDILGMRLDVIAHRGLEAREAEVVRGIPDEPARKTKCTRIARSGNTVDRRSAREAEPQNARHLIECFAGRVVERTADDPMAVRTLDRDKVCVTARDDKTHKRGRGRLFGVFAIL